MFFLFVSRKYFESKHLRNKYNKFDFDSSETKRYFRNKIYGNKN